MSQAMLRNQNIIFIQTEHPDDNLQYYAPDNFCHIVGEPDNDTASSYNFLL